MVKKVSFSRFGPFSPKSSKHGDLDWMVCRMIFLGDHFDATFNLLIDNPWIKIIMGCFIGRYDVVWRWWCYKIIHHRWLWIYYATSHLLWLCNESCAAVTADLLTWTLRHFWLWYFDFEIFRLRWIFKFLFGFSSSMIRTVVTAGLMTSLDDRQSEQVYP